MTPAIVSADDPSLQRFYRRGWDPPPEAVARVADILKSVRAQGDDALRRYSREFDYPEWEIADLRVPVPDLDEARRAIPGEVAHALELARERVEAFHRRQLPQAIEYVEEDGTEYAFCYRPLGSVAAYVPAGSAPLPSTVVMTVTPAKLAGVERIAVFSPLGRDGRIAAAILFACALCGADEIYAIGGAQAIAAAAFGTASVAPVQKIVGPGNLWVTEAKRQVAGFCAIDGLAGPSEVLVVADGAANPDYAVGELLAQAEHDPQARVAIVSESREFLETCAGRITQSAQQRLPRAAVIEAVLANGTALIHARNREEVFHAIESFAPEHLALLVQEPGAYLGRIRSAGAVFCGAETPVACGDYLAGTNHVLPTSGAARFSSGLRTADFLRSFSVVRNSRSRMLGDAPVIAALAEFEGLAAHARTARMRA